MPDIFSDTALLHPKFRRVAERLANELIAGYQAGETKTLYKVFETYRSPLRQHQLLSIKTTKAGPFQSAHQFGLAIDFVPYIDANEAIALAELIGERVWPGWNWHSSHDWEYLRKKAQALSLSTLEWDKPHCEHPEFRKLSSVMYNMTAK